MASGSSSTPIVSTSSSSKFKDIGWNYGTPVEGQRDHVKCNFCGAIKKGGITRHKQHLVGGFRNASKCPSCPLEVRTLLKEHMDKKLAEQELKNQIPTFDTIVDVDEDDEMENIPQAVSGQRGPLDMYYRREPSTKKRKDGGVDAAKCRKQLRDHVVQMFARWMYDAGIAFNAVNYESLQQAIEAIGQHGAGMKAPTMQEVRVTCLKKEKDHTEKLIKENKEEANKNGCTLMADGWTDRNGRVLVNFLMNTPKGSVFLDTVDASDYSKTGVKMCELLSKQIDLLGSENVVQVVTDNASENVKAGKRTAPLCGFSQRVVGILESQGVDYETVDVLDEEYNYGLRETLKSYSNWPTFPQVFVDGELIGGCDILTAMYEKGELANMLK